MRVATLSGGVWRGTTISSLPAIYDQTYSVGSTITTGTPVTLPASGSYNSTDLEISLNGQVLAITTDWTAASTTTVSFTFDLISGDLLHFRKIRDF